jgi:F-type H+-transporting ATPase subunit b
MRQRVKTEAQEEGDRIIQRAREEIDRERESALREVRGEISNMIIQASSQVIDRELDSEEHERLIEEALNNLEAEVVGSGVSKDGSSTA